MFDNMALLDALIADDARAEPRFRPTPYWGLYARRITDEIRASGLNGFRTNQGILKGFAAGGTWRPTIPSSPVKRMLWKGLAALPGVTSIIGEYERVLRAQNKQFRAVEASLARQVIERIAQLHPQLRIPDGLTNGGADDAFEWRGQQVSADFVMYLSRAADFYLKVKPGDVSWIIEIGPGIGLSTLAHVALNPNLKGALNADIVPVIYVSTQFLKSSKSIEVVDYLALRDSQEIAVSVGALPRVYSMPAWMLPRVKGPFDYGFNAFSFQEMEEDVCAAYANDLTARLGKGMMLHNSVQGHKPGAGGQRKPVTLPFLRGLYRPSFPNEEQVGGLFCEAYGGQPEASILMRK